MNCPFLGRGYYNLENDGFSNSPKAYNVIVEDKLKNYDQKKVSSPLQ